MINLFNNENNKIIITDFINTINYELKKEINVKNILNDLITLTKNNHYNEYDDLINNTVENINIYNLEFENLFNTIVLIKKTNNIKLKNKCVKQFIIKILNENNIENDNFYNTTLKCVNHIHHLLSGKCSEFIHFKNLLKNNKFNKSIK